MNSDKTEKVKADFFNMFKYGPDYKGFYEYLGYSLKWLQCSAVLDGLNSAWNSLLSMAPTFCPDHLLILPLLDEIVSCKKSFQDPQDIASWHF